MEHSSLARPDGRQDQESGRVALSAEPQPTRAAPTPVFEASKAGLRLKMCFGLAAVDVSSVTIAFLLANLLRVGTYSFTASFDVLAVLLPVFIAISFSSGAYSDEVLKAPKLGLKRSLRSLAVAIALVIGIFYYLKAGASISRMIMTVGSAGSVLFVITGRWLLTRLAKARWELTNELVLVDGDQARVLHGGQRVVLSKQENLRPTLGDPMVLHRLGTLLKHCDRVVLVCAEDQRAAWAKMMKGVDVTVEILTPELDQLGALGIGQCSNGLTMVVNRGPLSFQNRVAKRIFDLAVTITALVLSAPLFLLISFGIKLDSSGPIFFRQRRMGCGNRVFEILKFRTMRVNATDEDGLRSTDRHDERITRVGAILRHTSLDELPQFLNVLRGDMSVVGPRPHALGSTAEDLLFWDIDARYWQRHTIKPGITGLAQIRGLRGATHRRSDLYNRLQADLEYIDGWSIWRDCGILFATAKVLFHRNAY